MGVCRTDKLDISYFINKDKTFKKIPSGHYIHLKRKQSSYFSENNPSLSSISINNVLFNNKKINTSSYSKKSPQKISKNSFQNKLKNISYNNNYKKTSIINNYSKKDYNAPIKIKPITLKKITNLKHSSLNESEIEKYPLDSNRKQRKFLKNEKELNTININKSPNKHITSNSFNKIKSKSVSSFNTKPQYIDKKIITDEDDTDTILSHLEEEIKKENIKKNNALILSFNDENKDEDIQLYYLNEFHFNPENKYSSEKDFDNLLQSKKFKNKITLSNLLLFLPERNWYKELIELSDAIKINRIKKNTELNEYLNKFIKIYNHFNHLVWALGYFYSNALLYNKISWFKKDKLNLPEHNSLDWIKGFEWKGLHIKLLTYDKSKKLIHEIKALKYILFDYLQLFNTSSKINDNNNIDYNNLLSNEIIFPFMSYAYVGGIIIYVSVEIKKIFYDENFLMTNVNINNENKLEKMRISLIRKSLRLSIKYDNYDYNFDDDINNISFDENIINDEINLSNYSKSDLNNTKILHKITDNNLLKIFEDSNENKNIKERRFKFILINIYSLLPNLFKEDDKTIYTRLNQINCIDIKNEFEAPRFINLTKINNLDKNNEMSIVSKLIRINATRDNIGIYRNKFDDIDYKIIYDNNNKGNKINEQVTKFFVQFPLIQNTELSRLLTTEYLNVGNLNIILNNYNTENTQEIPDRNIILYRTTFQVKMKYSIITPTKEQLFPKSNEEYISYFKQICKELCENSNKIRNIDNLNDFCERFGFNKKFLPFCLEFIDDEYLKNLIQIYLYTYFIKKFYNYHEGQTLFMKLAIYERNKDEAIINSSDFIKDKDNNIIEMQKQFIIDIIKLIFLPVESLKAETKEPFSKKFFQNISFFIFLKMLKLKNFEKYISFKSILCQLEIKQILVGFNEISRNNPFLFIDSLEKMINFRMNPFIKYRASIDINNLKNLNKDNISIFSPKINTFVNFSSITSYIFNNFASNTPPPTQKEKKNINYNPLLSNIELDNYFQYLMFKNPISFDKNNNLLLISNHYYIYNEEMMNKYCYVLEQIFDGIISYNGEKELIYLKSYLYLLLNSIFYQNNIKKSKEILNKIKQFLKYQYLFSFTQYSVLNLLEALIYSEDISYSEELYSKALILSLLNQGDIRTKARKIHQFLMFPLFQLSKIISVYNNYYLNEYLNELNFILNKKIHHQVESDNKNKKVNLGYYNFPFEYFLSPKDNEIKNDYLDDINFKQFICKVIIDYFYSFDNLLFDDDLLLFFKINIKEENEIEVNDKNLDNNHKRIKTDESFNTFNKYISECLLDEMSYKKYAPSDIVISFGENNYSQTAQENSDIIMNPRIIYSLLNKKIKKIFSGYNNNFAIDEKDNIYSWGLNTDGQCGIPEKKINKIPKEVKILDLENEEKIIDITFGNNFTFFLSNNNKVYLCGYNLLTKEKYFSPKRIQFSFEKEKISRIEVGFKFCLILTGWGNVYSYGEVENGELGHEINYEKTNDPKLVLNIRNIRLISCGYRHCLAIGKNNIVFCWGSNENGQLGLNINSKNKNIINIPNKLNINNEITNIFCGKDFTIFHTDKKEILVCGKNEEGQLGIGKEVYSKFQNDNDCIKPIKVEQFYNLEIIKVSCGENSCIAMVQDSTSKNINIWSWGNNKKGQLGLGKSIENSRPKPIPGLLEFINHCPKDITCGQNHCLVLLERKDDSNINIDYNKIINDLIIKYNKF